MPTPEIWNSFEVERSFADGRAKPAEDFVPDLDDRKHLLALASDMPKSALPPGHDLMSWACFVSPPREWPACFSMPALKRFVMTELQGKRVRLIGPPPPTELARAQKLGMDEEDTRANAIKVRSALGWEIIAGFALLEKARASGVEAPTFVDEARAMSANPIYVGHQRWWNVTPKGIWLDLSPRKYKKMVLVESAKVEVPAPTGEEAERIADGPALAADETKAHVHCHGVDVVILLKAKYISKPFMIAVFEPFYKAYVRKCPGSTLIDKHALRAVELEGEPVTALSTAANRLLVRQEMRIELKFFDEGSAERGFLKRVGLGLPQLIDAAELPWYHKSFGPADVELFARLAAEHGPLARLRSLQLYENAIGDAGLELLAPVLAASLPALESLGLHSNAIGDKGVLALCASPPAGKLEKLTLGRNAIGDEGFDALASALAARRLVVKQLAADENKASDLAAERLREACSAARAA